MAEISIRSVSRIRDNGLRTIRNGLARIGIDANVTPKSDWYVLWEAIANQIVVGEANGVLMVESVMPDTATGDYLTRGAEVFGAIARPATGAQFSVIFDTAATSPTAISAGAKLIDGAGLTFEVVTGASYSDGDEIPVRAVDVGEQTNHVEGDVLRWVSPPVSANEKALVSASGISKGTEGDDEDTLRARWISTLQDPPRTGNAGHVALIAEESSSAVHKAFVYPALQGAGTYGVVVVKAPSATDKSREIAGSLLSGTVVPYIEAQMPEHTHSIITTCEDVNADVAFGLVLPESPTANPPGPGGGWVNGNPWPAPNASSTWRCTVTAVTDSLTFTVDATTPPSAGVSEVCWLSPYDWTLYRATVSSFTGTSGAYEVTLNSPFPDVAVGCHIWPACENAQVYVDAVLGAFKRMGPGEKTSNVSALVRGYRRPRPASSWPYSLGGHLTRAIATAAPLREVESAQFLHRTDGTTTVTGSAGAVNPQVPASVTDPAKIFVPRHISFYRVP